MKKSPVLAGLAIIVVIVGLANFARSFATSGPPDSSVIYTHLAAIAAMAYLLFAYGFPAFTGRGQPRGEVPAPDSPLLAEARCSGRIGLVRFSGPLGVRHAIHELRTARRNQRPW
jgi:hypothetical protein